MGGLIFFEFVKFNGVLDFLGLLLTGINNYLPDRIKVVNLPTYFYTSNHEKRDTPGKLQIMYF